MTVFGRIIRGELPADVVYEDDQVIAFKDIAPHAPIHILIVPKKPWKNLQDVPKQELGILGHVADVAQEIAQELDIEDGYRLLTNCGEAAGQTVFHLHFHLLAGKPFTNLC